MTRWRLLLLVFGVLAGGSRFPGGEGRARCGRAQVQRGGAGGCLQGDLSSQSSTPASTSTTFALGVSPNGSRKALPLPWRHRRDQRAPTRSTAIRGEGICAVVPPVATLYPTERVWFDSATVVGRLAAAKGYDSRKVRALSFDALIALTARSIGATVITLNRQDFEDVRSYRRFRLLCWE